jgi:putative membrane protein
MDDMRFIAKIFLVILLNAIVFWAMGSYVFPESFSVTGGPEGYFFVAIVFALLNMFIKPLLSIITLPFRILSLGLLGFVLNAFMLWLLESSVNFLEMFNTSVEIDGVATYLLAGVILSILNTLFNWLRN